MQSKPVRLVRGAVGAVTGFAKGAIKGVPQAAVGVLGVAAGMTPFYYGGDSIASGLGFLGRGIATPFTYAKKNALKQYYRPEYNAKKTLFKQAMSKNDIYLS